MYGVIYAIVSAFLRVFKDRLRFVIDCLGFSSEIYCVLQSVIALAIEGDGLCTLKS